MSLVCNVWLVWSDWLKTVLPLNLTKSVETKHNDLNDNTALQLNDQINI